MKTYITILLFLPILLMAGMRQEYAEYFSENFERFEIKECSRILEEWEKNLDRRQRIGSDNISFPSLSRIRSFCEITKL